MKKEEPLDFVPDLSPEREKIIQRIMSLSDEQFDLLLTLYSRQDQESC